VRWTAATFLCALGLASGCGAALVLHRDVPRPAAIPARSYPVVYIAARDEGSREAADAIATHLAQGPTRVVRTEPDALFVAARTESAPTLALLVAVTLGETLRTEMSMPMTHCAPDTPCYGYAERYPVDVLVQLGELVVRAFDPRTEAELGHAVVTREESEPSPIAAQMAVRSRLVAAASSLFDVHGEIHDLELDGTSDTIAAAALDDARRGEIHVARLALEARADEVTLDPSQRAAVLFDLGQLIRVDVDATASDPLAEETTRLAAAEARILQAITLAPEERHERALVQLRAERASREDVRAQQAATDTNFGVASAPSP
jgi:hypothetical protein